jgi:hypothetical protein
LIGLVLAHVVCMLRLTSLTYQLFSKNFDFDF